MMLRMRCGGGRVVSRRAAIAPVATNSSQHTQGAARRRRLGALMLAGGLVSGCSTVAAGMAVPAADLGHAIAPVPVAALDHFLLPAEQLNAAINTAGLVAEDVKSRMSGGQTTANDCAAVWRVAWGPVYRGSGWVAVRHQFFHKGDDQRFTNKVFEAVVLFPLPVDATAFYVKQVAAWRTCNGRRLEERMPDEEVSKDDFWKMGEVSDHDGMLSVTSTQEDSDTWGCQRALTIRNNVAIDVDACADRGVDQGETIANAIAAKVPVK